MIRRVVLVVFLAVDVLVTVGCTVAAGYLPAPSSSTVPACPAVSYDGDLSVGPVWAGGSVPGFECAGPGYRSLP